MSWINTARQVVAGKQYARVNLRTGLARTGQDSGGPPEEHTKQKGKAVVLDLFTASMLVQVYDALNETNRAKFDAMPLLRAVDIGWKLVKKDS